jgi:hypothetical protein
MRKIRANQEAKVFHSNVKPTAEAGVDPVNEFVHFEQLAI